MGAMWKSYREVSSRVLLRKPLNGTNGFSQTWTLLKCLILKRNITESPIQDFISQKYPLWFSCTNFKITSLQILSFFFTSIKDTHEGPVIIYWVMEGPQNWEKVWPRSCYPTPIKGLKRIDPQKTQTTKIVTLPNGKTGNKTGSYK